MDVYKTGRGPGLLLYYTPEYRKVIEDHLELIRNHASTQRITIPLDDLHRYKWNLTGYLATIAVASNQDLFWIIMRVSGYLCDEDFDGTNDQLLIPSNTMLEDIRQRYLMQASI